MFNVVLYSPQIPQNTGNIARLCAATNCKLHLVRPLGFRIDDYGLKRAGLDYWEYVNLVIHESFDAFLEQIKDNKFYLISKRGHSLWSEINYNVGDFFIFGNETQGLPEDFLRLNADKTVRIPHLSSDVRSLNLALSVGVIVYEAIRKNFNLFQEKTIGERF